ncbi:MAG: hypothetical protein D6755_02920 [Anaerolineae bacterium]|nr:MAG: hypothetical protein D6755_02920 [Anaerolineae bacterium]
MHTWHSHIAARDIHGRIRISCPPERIPHPGQYLLAQGEPASLLAVPLYPGGKPSQGGLWCAPTAPSTWLPGTTLHLRGPLGRGFRGALHARRLVAFSPDAFPWVLLPLIHRVLQNGGEAALFSPPLPSGVPLPAALEILPLEALSETMQTWGDFWAACCPLESLPHLRVVVGKRPPIPGEVFVHTLMPCGGLADCGVCAVSLHGKPMLVCKQGPVLPWLP